MTLEAMKAAKWLKLKNLPEPPCGFEEIEVFAVQHVKTIEEFDRIKNFQSLNERYTGSAIDEKNIIRVYIHDTTEWVMLRPGEKYGSNYSYETPVDRQGEKVIDFIITHYLTVPWYIIVRERGYSYIEGQQDTTWDRMEVYVIHLNASTIIDYYLKDVEKL
mgnify:CR=1 FL=1